MKRINILKLTQLLIPRIECVLKAKDITPYEKTVLIERHIKDWRQ